MKKQTVSAWLSCLLCLLLLLSPCLGVDSFAFDSTNNLIDSQNMNDWDIQSNGTYEITYSASTNSNRINIPRGTGNTSSYYTYYFYELEDLSLKDEYTFSFSFMSNNLSSYDVQACLFVLTAGGSIVQTPATIVNISSPTGNSQYQSYSCRFIPQELITVSSGYRLAVGFYFHGGNNINTSTTNSCWIRDISLVNNDDDSGFWNSIINMVGYIGIRLDDFIGSMSSWLTAVKDGIVNKLQDVKSGITSALDTVKTGIQNTLNTVKTAITDKLEAVKTAISNTVNNAFDSLKSYLRSLFIPSDGYFAEKVNELKLWAEQHLGFLYTGASMFANFIQEISDMFVSDSYQFSIPDIDFTVAGQRIQLELSDSIVGVNSVLNDSVFAGLYTFYKTLLGMALGFALFKYSELALTKILSN